MSTARTKRGYQRIAGVTYDSYVRMRGDWRNQHLRMAYHDGVLEIMSPDFRHDHGSRRLYNVILAYAAAFDVPCEPAGSTTFRAGVAGELTGLGREADESFYIGDVVGEILAKDSLDLTIDPPPSLWVEVDNWGSSKAKLPLYAGLRVPEIWRYRVRRQKLWFGRLSGDTYTSIDRSEILPGLTPAIVLELLVENARRPSSAWVKWMINEWFPTHRAEMGLD